MEYMPIKLIQPECPGTRGLLKGTWMESSPAFLVL